MQEDEALLNQAWDAEEALLNEAWDAEEALLNEAWDAQEAMSEEPASPDSLQPRGKAAQPEAAGALALPTNPAVQASGSFGGADDHGRDPDAYSIGGHYYGLEPGADDHSYGGPARSADDHSYGQPAGSADDHSYGHAARAAHHHSHGRPAISADDTSRDYSSVTSVEDDYNGADSASSVGNGIRASSGVGGSGVDKAAADSGLAPVVPGQRRVQGEEQGRGAGSDAEMSERGTSKEEASHFLADLGCKYALHLRLIVLKQFGSV